MYQKTTWMFNGAVPTNATSTQQQRRVLKCIPGGFTYHGIRGQACISVPDYTRTAQEQSVGTIDERILIAPPAVEYPGGGEKVTSMNVQYGDITKGFEPEDVIYPVPGTRLYNTLLLTTNGEPNTQRMTIEGAIDPDQAHTIAISEILQSHRFLGQAQIRAEAIINIREGSIMRLSLIHI